MDEPYVLPPRAAIHDAVMLPVNLVRPNPWNRVVSDARLAELAQSVRQVGVMQPVVVRPAADAKPGAPLYELIAGERRWRASQLAGLAEVPALVREMDDDGVVELMLVENLQREDLHPLDEAAGYDRLLRKDTGPQALRGFASVAELAARMGKSPSYVVQRLRLLKLCPSAVEAFRDGKLSFSLALRIARLPQQADQATATREILTGWANEPMTAREADEYIQREFMLDLSRAAFPLHDAKLLPEAGACLQCPKRTGANAELWEEHAKRDTCTDSECHELKTRAHADRVKAEAQERGLKVIQGPDARKLQPQRHTQPKGLVPLDDVHHGIDAVRPLREVLADAKVERVLFEDPHTHQLREMVPEGAVAVALKAAGVLKQAKLPSTGSSPSQREQDAKRNAENAYRQALAEALLAAAAGPAAQAGGYQAALLRMTARRVWHEMSTDGNRRVAKLLGWPPLKPRWDRGPGITADEHISNLTDIELTRYLTCACIQHELQLASYQQIDKPADMLALAESLRVDPKAVRAGMADAKRVRSAGKAAEATPETALAQAVRNAKPARKAAAKKSLAARGIKYRNAQTGEVWSGRGLQPRWLKVQLEAGATLADFEV